MFIIGTDTGVGKTLICSWLCLKTGYDYYKPIQTGPERDTAAVLDIAGVQVHMESYYYKTPVSPHLAAAIEQVEIDISNIQVPDSANLIIEGSGGVLVPLNRTQFIIDLVRRVGLPVILVASSRLGTINHTLLTLEALRARHVNVLGVIINGPLNQGNADAISYYGGVEVLAQFDFIDNVNRYKIGTVMLTPSLQHIFQQQ